MKSHNTNRVAKLRLTLTYITLAIATIAAIFTYFFTTSNDTLNLMVWGNDETPGAVLTVFVESLKFSNPQVSEMLNAGIMAYAGVAAALLCLVMIIIKTHWAFIGNFFTPIIAGVTLSFNFLLNKTLGDFSEVDVALSSIIMMVVAALCLAGSIAISVTIPKLHKRHHVSAHPVGVDEEWYRHGGTNDGDSHGDGSKHKDHFAGVPFEKRFDRPGYTIGVEKKEEPIPAPLPPEPQPIVEPTPASQEPVEQPQPEPEQVVQEPVEEEKPAEEVTPVEETPVEETHDAETPSPDSAHEEQETEPTQENPAPVNEEPTPETPVREEKTPESEPAPDPEPVEPVEREKPRMPQPIFISADPDLPAPAITPVSVAPTPVAEEEPKKKVSGRYEIYYEAGFFKYRLKANNGQILIVSNSYVSKTSARNAIDTLKKNVEVGVHKIVTDKNGYGQFRIYTSNDSRLVVSGEIYPSTEGAVNALNSVLGFYMTDDVVELPKIPEDEVREWKVSLPVPDPKGDGKMELRKVGEEWIGRLIASNGEVLFQTSTYSSKSALELGLVKIKDKLLGGNVSILADKQKRYQFKVYNDTLQILVLGQTYPSKDGAISAAVSSRNFLAGNPKVVEA